MEKLWMTFQSFLNQIDNSKIIEKGILIVIVLVVVIVSIKVCFRLIDGFFKYNKPGLEPREIRRLTTLNKVVKTGTRASIWTVGIMVILGQFTDVGSLLAVAGVGTLAIGFGAQGIVEDVMSGFVIVFENQFSVGDYVTIDENHYGIVESIGIRTTCVRELNGGLFIIHNGKIDRLVNYSKGFIKATVDIGVAYEEDIDGVINIIKEVCNKVYHEHTELFKGEPEVLGVTRMDPSAMNIRIIADEDAATKVKAEAILRQKIKEAFDEKGIEIPYSKSVILTRSAGEKVGS